MKTSKPKTITKASGKKILDDFAKLGIRPSDYPPYTSAKDYVKGFKRCSILESVGYTYSSSTTP